MTQVTRTILLRAAPQDVWNVIGAFQGIGDWHPAIKGCTRQDIDGQEHRRLDLGDGAVLVEKLWGVDGMSMGYSIEEGPLPFRDYRSTLMVQDFGGRACVLWSSSFVPTADNAAEICAGIYEAGFDALKERFDR